MHTILIVDNHSRTGQLYTAGLEAYVGATVVEINDVNEASEYIFAQPPSIIITRSPIHERDIAYKFSVMITQKKLDTKLIVIGKTKISSHEAAIFDEAVEVREIIRKCAQLLGVTARDMAEKDVGKFYPIKTSLLCPQLVLVCPIYRKVPGTDAYFRFLDKEHKIHAEVLSILNAENEHAIYVEASDRLKFVNSLTVFLSEILADDSMSLEDSILFANQGYRVVRDAARKMMMTPEVIQMTENNINTMTSIVNRIPKLKELMEMTTKNVTLMFRHSLLVSFIASHVINKMEWGTQEQKVKIVFVAFFHDIVLPDDKYVLIHSEEELNALDAPQDVKLNIQRHAINCAKMLTKYHTRIPFGVETIIKQHHGARDGIGFSTYPMSISPLALLFMVAEEWVHLILKAEELNIKLERKDILQKLRLKYKGFSYDAILRALEDLTI